MYNTILIYILKARHEVLTRLHQKYVSLPLYWMILVTFLFCGFAFFVFRSRRGHCHRTDSDRFTLPSKESLYIK